MEFPLVKTAPADAVSLGVPVFKGETSGPGAELDAGFLSERGFDGKAGEVIVMPAEGGGSVVALGMGPRESVDAEGLRRAAALLVRTAWKDARVATTLLDAAPAGLDRARAAQAIAEGASMGAYRFGRYKSKSEPCAIESFAVVGRGGAGIAAALERGAAIGDAVNLARDLVNTPAGDMTPARLADIATDVAQRVGLAITVWDETTIVNERCGGLAGVAQGSTQPPRLIQLTYEPAKPARTTVALVGKGITFDSGGLSLKTADGMETMKTDMSGAAAVLAAMSVLGAVGAKSRVLAFIPATENMPSGAAVKPGDVLKFRNGKTAEVLNTDAEGRLVLADGLSLAAENGVDAIVDVATLTGACVVALGPKVAGLMGNSDDWMSQVQAAAARAGERVWPLPLPDDYRRMIDSEIADMKNTGGRYGGAITAGLFLKEFVGDVPWAHLDIAGPARSDTDDGYTPKGGTGVAVRTLVEAVAGFSKPAAPPAEAGVSPE
jgi:leucyl aminopeptidase